MYVSLSKSQIDRPRAVRWMRKEAGQAALVGFASPGDSVIAVRDSAAAAAAPVQRRRYCSSFFCFFASFGWCMEAGLWSYRLRSLAPPCDMRARTRTSTPGLFWLGTVRAAVRWRGSVTRWPTPTAEPGVVADWPLRPRMDGQLAPSFLGVFPVDFAFSVSGFDVGGNACSTVWFWSVRRRDR